MCMWLFHICCAMGGEMKQIPQASTEVNAMCPLGTICCPRVDDLRGEGGTDPVPWDISTVKMLNALSHGRMQYTPVKQKNDVLGWEGKDGINPLGPSQCVNKQTIVSAYNKKDTVASAKVEGGDKSEYVACRFECIVKHRKMKSNEKCMKEEGNGRTPIVLIRGHPRGQCDKPGKGINKNRDGEGSARPLADWICGHYAKDLKTAKNKVCLSNENDFESSMKGKYYQEQTKHGYAHVVGIGYPDNEYASDALDDKVDPSVIQIKSSEIFLAQMPSKALDWENAKKLKEGHKNHFVFPDLKDEDGKVKFFATYTPVDVTDEEKEEIKKNYLAKLKKITNI